MAETSPGVARKRVASGAWYDADGTKFGTKTGVVCYVTLAVRGGDSPKARPIR